MESNYWSKVLYARINRRRSLAIAGFGAIGTAFLAACGSDGGVSQDPDSSAGLVTKPVDTTKQAKRGGTVRWFGASEPAHTDIHIGLAPLNTPNNLINDNLVNEKAGHLQEPAYNEVVPAAAESWEWSGDRTQLTMKIRQGIKWHNKPPINGRAFDVEDIVFSWERFSQKGQGRQTVANVANPNAPVLGVTAMDDRTIVWKLKEPVVFFLSQLTPAQTGNFQLVPKETDSAFDNRRDLIGIGAFILTEHTPSSRMVFQRNEEYWDLKSGAFADTIEYPFILEYAQGLAQLKAGNLFTYDARVRQEDIVPLKRDNPGLNMFQVQPSSFSPGNTIQFGVTPVDENKPFKDERVRQAMSMALDRDIYLDTFNNVAKFQVDGLPVEGYWYTAIGSNAGWWLDPKGKDFGPNAKYFEYNPAEAQKLLAAAGYPDGFEVTSNYISGTQLGPDFQKTVEVRANMLTEIGVRQNVNLIDYTKEYIPSILLSKGQFTGMAYRSGVASANDAVTWLDWRYKSGGGDGWIGFDKAGKGDGSGDPEVDAMIVKARAEIDTQKRKALVYDLQRYLAKAMYCISQPGTADTFQMAWEALANYHVSNGDRRTSAFGWWVDETKRPLA